MSENCLTVRREHALRISEYRAFRRLFTGKKGSNRNTEKITQ
jgi:hypothetical protein